MVMIVNNSSRLSMNRNRVTIRTMMYPEIHPSSQEISDEVFQANHSAQHKEYPENSSNEIVVLNYNQEKEGPPQDSDIHQLIREECCIEVCAEQNQKIEDTILELVKICRQKELLCMHDNVDDLIESSLNSKLLSINSQRLEKEKQEVKNVVKQPAERRPRIIESLQDFRAIHKNSISLNNTRTHSINQKPEYSPSENEVTLEDEKIMKSNFDFEEEICLIENLVYDNSSSRPPKEHNAEEERIKREHAEYISRMEMLFTINPRPRPMVNANTIVESFPSSLIPIQDNDSQREEIDIVTNTDELLPPGIENDDDSEGEINVVEELHVFNSISILITRQFHDLIRNHQMMSLILSQIRE
nr:hypothetical protein [Tanacetum cinerariifolium]